ncbi:cyclic lactone autoinducer peptide [Brevibacillus gelatini]|uniref:Cyclic lactone autoinducer peptide n=1 Tax=Brevibacillus gelatini TaxID=1655277 RepID=A0A3M8B822_9BACL|nr:cyclic lactone autoinducer peptide [Brevibacillus gelatini]RNB59452.1 cyclic lactone autoinducer peptide [Brevibacillus gelatini]
MKAFLAKQISRFLAIVAVLVVSPYSAALIHQPEAPQELYKNN